MKRYLIVLVVILVLTPVFLVGCAQAELESRITSLETKLIAAESTIKVLQGRIEQLENEPLTEEEILTTLYGKELWANVGPLQQGDRWVNRVVSIKFKELRRD